MHLRRQLFVEFALALGLTTLGGRVAAQVTIEAGPTVGYYSSTPRESSDGPNAPGNFSRRGYGGEGMVWFAHRVGIRADYLVATSDRDAVPNPGGFQPALSGRIQAGSVLAIYDVSPNHPQLLWISAGPGVVRHDGEAFRQSGNPTNTAGILGIGSTLPLGSALCITLSGSAFFYRYTGVFGVVGGPPGYVAPDIVARRFQRDRVVRAAIVWNGR